MNIEKLKLKLIEKNIMTESDTIIEYTKKAQICDSESFIKADIFSDYNSFLQNIFDTYNTEEILTMFGITSEQVMEKFNGEYIGKKKIMIKSYKYKQEEKITREDIMNAMPLI